MESPVFAINVRRIDGQAVVDVLGELDGETAPQLQRVLSDLIDGQGNVSLALDLTELTFVDSTGIALLVQAHKALRRPPLMLFGVRSHIRNVLDVCGLTETFDISDHAPGSGAGALDAHLGLTG